MKSRRKRTFDPLGYEGRSKVLYAMITGHDKGHNTNTRLSSMLKITRSATSQHVSKLREMKIVNEKPESPYDLNWEALIDIFIERLCDPEALVPPKTHVYWDIYGYAESKRMRQDSVTRIIEAYKSVLQARSSALSKKLKNSELIREWVKDYVTAISRMYVEGMQKKDTEMWAAPRSPTTFASIINDFLEFLVDAKFEGTELKGVEKKELCKTLEELQMLHWFPRSKFLRLTYVFFKVGGEKLGLLEKSFDAEFKEEYKKESRYWSALEKEILDKVKEYARTRRLSRPSFPSSIE